MHLFSEKKVKEKMQHEAEAKFWATPELLEQLEFKLKSTDEAERMGSVSLLARMFSEKDSMLAVNHRQLWQVDT